MNNTKNIASARLLKGDYFEIKYNRDSDKYLKDFIHLFNFDDYWCYKNTRHQRLVTKEEFLEFKYSAYIFFKKDLYDVNRIEQWVNWMKDMGGVQFLVKPTPPFNPNKVIIKN